jgi:CheY-like chemotaxis protein
MAKILLVEDDSFLRGLIGKKLADKKYEIIYASDGEKALELLKGDKPDLILLDILLPGIDGFEVLKKIKQDSKLSNIPVIIISNLMQQKDIDKAKSLGATDYLVKVQFTTDEISEKIKEVLNK